MIRKKVIKGWIPARRKRLSPWRIWRRLNRTRKRQTIIALQIGIVAAVVVIAVVRLQEKNIMIHLHCAPLLNTIAKGESGGNYNAYYGNAGNSTIKFTDMTIDQVQAWQAQYARQGSPSTAVGRYQFMQSTLAGLVKKQHIDPAERFDQAMQDRLAIALLERRGLREYAEGKLTREQFAHNLSREWAALPAMSGPQPHQSFYEGDGLNTARIKPTEVIDSIAALH